MSFDPHHEEYLATLPDFNPHLQRLEESPRGKQRLGWFTVMCLILNRSIGSGIFATPSRIILSTGNVGPSLVLWVIGGVVAMAGLYTWSELGLSVPRRVDPESREEKSVPCNGGEKNFFEFLFPSPRFMTTCMFGIVFIILGNLTGNAIQLGIFTMTAAGYDNPSKGSVLGIAIAALSFAALVHAFTRRGGILMNNAFAIFKVSLLVAMIALGIAWKCGRDFGGGNTPTKNFENPFSGSSGHLADYVESLLYILFTYSGFKQPFYVLSEVETPRRIFPIATTAAVALQWLLFVLVNVVYIWAVDLSRLQATTLDDYNGPVDMAALFFESIFGKESPTPRRVMTGLLALAILGNIVVITFTAARVKQEIAKQGILPWSLFFATSTATPWAWLRAFQLKYRTRHSHSVREPSFEEKYPDQSPIAALLLHWFSSVFLIAVTAGLDPNTSYSFLTSLYAYVINGMMGFIVAGGLLHLKYFHRGEWALISQFSLGRSRWTSSLPAWITCLFTGFLLVASFVPPATGVSNYIGSRAGIPWYIIPAIGMSTPLWGLIWYGGLKVVERSRGETLEVFRDATIEEFKWPNGERSEWILISEVIKRHWMSRGHHPDEYRMD